MIFDSQEILVLVGLAFAAFLVGFRIGLRPAGRRSRDLEAAASGFESRLRSQRQAADDLRQRCAAAEEMVRRLQRSIVEMPEIAQRLSAARNLREIPERTLELIGEVFDPSYSVFYRAGRKDLVAVACRGESEFPVGHRVLPGEGVVGWTAVKQLAFTAEDAELESGLVRSRNLAKGMPEKGFSLCLPILSGERTIGAILIGPCRRSLPHLREIGRTIALITSVSVTSAVVLREQKVLAETDGLTRLLNKRQVLSSLRELITEEDGAPRALTVFLFDIDHFKHYNDTNGHLPGDELLRALAELLTENIREDELLGRYGGEEFLLVMPGVAKGEALRAAERLRALVAVTPFPFRESQPGGAVTVSGGIATWPGDGQDVESLLRNADEALYAAKRAGRNRVVAYDPPGRFLSADETAATADEAKPAVES